MSDKQLAAIEGEQEIPCMLLPMVGHHLLVPTTSVAEMSAVRLLEEVAEAPDWLLGLYDWRGTKVPVVSEEALNGEGAIELNMQGRIAVLNNTGINPDLPFIAIHTQGIPRMARVADEDISENASAGRRPFDIMSVKVGLEEFYIPDISAIEASYLTYIKDR